MIVLFLLIADLPRDTAMVPSKTASEVVFGLGKENLFVWPKGTGQVPNAMDGVEFKNLFYLQSGDTLILSDKFSTNDLTLVKVTGEPLHVPLSESFPLLGADIKGDQLFLAGYSGAEILLRRYSLSGTKTWEKHLIFKEMEHGHTALYSLFYKDTWFVYADKSYELLLVSDKLNVARIQLRMPDYITQYSRTLMDQMLELHLQKKTNELQALCSENQDQVLAVVAHGMFEYDGLIHISYRVIRLNGCIVGEGLIEWKESSEVLALDPLDGQIVRSSVYPDYVVMGRIGKRLLGWSPLDTLPRYIEMDYKK